MSINNEVLKSPSEAELNLYSILPQDPKAIIQINHGMAEHAARYHDFMIKLADAGYGAYAHDHRGHGKTKAKDAHQGYYGTPNGFDKVIEDVDAVIDHIKSKHEGKKVLSFGHSMGCIIAFNYALRHPGKIDGLALWNSGVETGILAPIFKILLRIEAFFKGSDVPSLLAQNLTFKPWNKKFAPNRTDFDWLSKDETEVDLYINNPLCGFPVTNRLWQDLLGAIYFAADNKNLAKLPKALPVNIVAGDQDPCTEFGKASKHIHDRMIALKMNNVTLDIKKGARHETLKELERDAYMQDFIDWLNQHLNDAP